MNGVRGWIIAGVVLIALTFLVTIGVLKVKEDEPANNSGAYYQVYENA